MKQLIFNADDFGMTRGVNDGIIRGHREGILTSTTLMANGLAFDDAVQKALENPKLGVGCHLVLVGGKPVAPPESVASLLDLQGNLPGNEKNSGGGQPTQPPRQPQTYACASLGDGSGGQGRATIWNHQNTQANRKPPRLLGNKPR